MATVAGAVLVRYTGLPLHALGLPAGSAILLLATFVLLRIMVASSGLGRSLIAMAAVLAVTSAAEVSGLWFGVPFGEYNYTVLWRPSLELRDGKLFPILLPLAWFILIYCSYQLAYGYVSAPSSFLAGEAAGVFPEPKTPVPGWWPGLPERS
jgi:uncharacterized membrane protein